jgi:VWFA-related protein
VFDRLSTEGRILAQNAARDFLERARRPGDVAGVFSTEGSLVVLQDFTTDGDLLSAAVEGLGSRVQHAGVSYTEVMRNRTEARSAVAAQMELGLRLGGGAGALARQQGRMMAIVQSAREHFAQLQRDTRGWATANALTALVEAMQNADGRRAVVLFSEALFRTDANEAQFLSVVHSANRANVVVYTLGAGGLQTRTLESVMRDEIRSVVAMRDLGVREGVDTGSAMLRQLETNEEIVRFNPEAGLDWISQRTGGFLVRDTNDLTDAVRQVDADLRTYYLLGYTPSNERWDGRFRTIEVKVRRKGVKVRSRSGYFAVRSDGPVLAHVAPALALLENGERPNVFDLFGGAVAFPEDQGLARVCLVVGAPGDGLIRSIRRAKRLDLTLLARVLDEDGHPVEVASRHLVIDAKDRVAREAEHRLLRDVWLPPGRYILESAAYEAESRRASVGVTAFEVGHGASPMDRTQLMLIREVLPVEEAGLRLEPGHPLRYGEILLIPSVGEPVHPGEGRPLVFQLIAPPGDVALDGSVSIWQGERPLGSSPVTLGTPGKDGFRRQVADLPLAQLDAGGYELRVTLTEEQRRRTLRVPFEIVR